MANDKPRVNNAEAHLLLAELGWLKSKLGADRTERVIGRPCDGAFVADCIGVADVPKGLRDRGYPFDTRVEPTPELERALKALWDAAPEEEFWRARA